MHPPAASGPDRRSARRSRAGRQTRSRDASYVTSAAPRAISRPQIIQKSLFFLFVLVFVFQAMKGNGIRDGLIFGVLFVAALVTVFFGLGKASHWVRRK